MVAKRTGRTQTKEMRMREYEGKDARELSSMLGEVEPNGVTPPTPPPKVGGVLLGLLTTGVDDGTGTDPPAVLQIPSKRNSSNQRSNKMSSTKWKE